MSDEDETAGGEEAVTVESLRERLEAIDERLEAAETEADLDEVEREIDDLQTDVEAADLPETDDEDEDDPVEELESDIESLESDLEEERGPYAEDVVGEIDDAKEEIAETRWTEQGESELVEAIRAALEDINAALGTSITLADDEELLERLTATLENVGTAVEAEDLDPDEDDETIEALLEATDDLQADVEAAQTWSDLSVREQLEVQGYYDVLDHIKDYPPEWHALKVHEKQGNVEMILLALETFDSDFMEEHCLEALERMGPQAALEPMLERAGKRDKDAISILGKIASDEPLDTLLDYVDADSDPLLQKTTFKALGEIGSEDAVQPLANKLVAENDEVRSQAARSLGLIGDTRAIDPLADVLADDDDDAVRASAAWALNQIGTEAALEAVSQYADDRAYLVQAEAEKVA
ncbi:HEAT repeat domain-containing protein [Halobacteria archaeon AArc-m2/3/4]|uniref:HEAT repeat domain-containing protein n=1 Tax=Natronoglomus mannanivorans TaxID=2979990 RepID=A0AAP3E1S8_9EURY|nr:HEAT repeat domain-containing protein [Halobacteria archaeon AArc-xg1-1]MCU4974608.1 HEAT repeat domain-containing protein [Halobacteria archaeon AArc-m2/3/4]